MQVDIRLDHLKDVQLEPNWGHVPSMLAQEISKSIDAQRLGFRNDAATGVIFAQQLQVISNRVRERAYPGFKAKNLMPMQSEAPFGAKEFAYVITDVAGMFELIANYADDLPVTSVKGEKKVVNINAYGGSVIYSIFDIAQATLAGINLVDREMMANRTAAEKKFDQIAWVGDAKAGTYGLYNAPNVTRITAPDGASGSSRWANKTGEEIYADLIAPYIQQAADTHGTEMPNTKVLTAADMARANTVRFDDVTGQTAMARFRQDYPNVNVETVEWFQGISPAGGNAMIDYNNDAEKIGVEVPQPYTVMPPEPRNLATVVNAYMTTAGTIVYFPLSVTVTEEI